VIVTFIDKNRDELGVEPICTALQVASSTYYAAKTRAVSARAARDAVMTGVLMALWVTNRKLYGAHKLWKAARRAGHDIGRDQVARLMCQMGICGVTRRRRVVTTRPDPDAVRAADLVNRDFTAERPNALWVTDLTYVPTRAGMAYVCFIVDAYSRAIVGWRVATNMRTAMVLDALEMARRSRGGRRLSGLVTHSDAGSLLSSPRCGSVNDWPRSERSHRSAPSPIRTTTRWPRRPTGSTRPSWSTGPTRMGGTMSTNSSWPP
jgi:putative transposase